MMTAIFSSLDLTTILTFVSVLIAGIWIFGTGNKRKLPPGPMGLPIVGYLPFLGKKPYEKLLELKKTYGPVYSLRIGSQTVVILADFPSMKEAFSKDAFIGRPPTIFPHNKETIECQAFIGLPWKELRRFSLQALRDLGLGKTRLEIHIAEEIQDLLQRFEKEKGKAIWPRNFLAPSTSNNIASLIFGERRKFNDPKRILLDKLLNQSTKLAEAVSWMEFFPFIKKITHFFGVSKAAKLEAAIFEARNFVKQEIREHINTFDPSNLRDYIDKYLVEMEKQKSNPKSIFITPVLEDISNGFFFAGSQTVRTALDWLLLVSAAYPHVQKRVQSEIDEVIGKERFPARSDYLQMPYTEATIMEALRWRASLPLNFPRLTLEDTQVGSHFIPKGTQIIPVTWAVHHDPDLWGEDVGCFKPERFLSEDGKKIQKTEYYIPFSIGKRSCPGESLAYVEIFMYYTAILRKFHLRLPEGVKADFEPTLSIGMETKPHSMYMDLR